VPQRDPYFVVDSRVVEDRWLVERFVVPPVRAAENALASSGGVHHPSARARRGGLGA